MTVKPLLPKLTLHFSALMLALTAFQALPASAAPTRHHHSRHHGRRSHGRRFNTIETVKKVKSPPRVTVPFHVPPGGPQ